MLKRTDSDVGSKEFACEKVHSALVVLVSVCLCRDKGRCRRQRSEVGFIEWRFQLIAMRLLHQTTFQEVISHNTTNNKDGHIIKITW